MIDAILTGVAISSSLYSVGYFVTVAILERWHR